MEFSGIDYLGIDRVLRRGSGEIIGQLKNALLIRDRISGAYLLACGDREEGTELLDRYIGRDCDLLMISDHALGTAAFERYGFPEKIECYQTAFYGEKPPIGTGRLRIGTAGEGDLAMLGEHYHMISKKELEDAVKRQAVLLGYDRDRLIGFIGEHAEGSMGMLYVFPEYRRMGFAAELQTHLIAKTMEKGYIPFGQVEKSNQASLRLQKKLGMTLSEHLIVWMWR